MSNGWIEVHVSQMTVKKVRNYPSFSCIYSFSLNNHSEEILDQEYFVIDDIEFTIMFCI